MQFEDTKTAYALKSDKELKRALFLFKVISKKKIVRLGGELILLALRLGLPLNSLLRRTVYQQFCAGTEEQDSIKIVNELASFNVKSYMHYAAEGQKSEAGMDLNLEKIIDTLLIASENKALPFSVFKPTGLGKVLLFEKKSGGIAFTESENLAWERMLERIHKCCSVAKKNRIRLLIDAEESWLQKAIDDIALDLMKQYNKKQLLIFTTLQMYRKDRLGYLKELMDIAKNEDFKLGVKLVRGAYMEKENDRSNQRGYPSPICISKEATDLNFNAGLEEILSNLNLCELFIGTHSEQSVTRVLKFMKENKLPADDRRIWFSQLYGMADHISFNIANAGYNVIKYVPYGPLKEVIPYLIRRAEENTSVQGQTPRELELIQKERLRRRKIKGSQKK